MPETQNLIEVKKDTIRYYFLLLQRNIYTLTKYKIFQKSEKNTYNITFVRNYFIIFEAM